MNRRKIIVVTITLFTAVLMVLYAPEKTTDINANRDVFYRFTWMPAYFSGDITQMWAIWSDRVYWPVLAGEVAVLAGAAFFLSLVTKKRTRRRPGRGPLS